MEKYTKLLKIYTKQIVKNKYYNLWNGRVLAKSWKVTLSVCHHKKWFVKLLYTTTLTTPVFFYFNITPFYSLMAQLDCYVAWYRYLNYLWNFQRQKNLKALELENYI